IRDFHVTGVQTCALPILNYIKTFLRHLKDGRMNKGVYYMLFRGYYRLAKKVTENVDVFLPNSYSEMKRVEQEYKLKNYKYMVVQIGRASCREREYVSRSE